ncbi:BQ2448_526 [Microbotryum intermedium]|uniref:BQ2448_526 protein n=1 Tax=Microbotryum intermedium TaxID=269621 RepID=A0A238F5L2_9BASI|nr:BQ2448_526 [Microbotryum intermedium]
MATPTAAAQIFKAALPSRNGSSGGGPASIRGAAGAAGAGRGGRRNEDVGMSDASSGVVRKAKMGGHRSGGPMGERPGKGNRSGRDGPSGGRNQGPAVIHDTSRNDDASAEKAPRSTNNIDNLRLFLSMRYSVELRMLNLEYLADDPTLKKYGIMPPGHKDSATNLAAVWWKLAAEMFPEVVSLSLANNNFPSLLPFSPHLLTTSLPNIENLSLANNRLRAFHDLDSLSPHTGKVRNDGKPKGFPKLKELVLKGNPMVEKSDYKRQIARRFSTLSSLDQEPIDTSIAFSDRPGDSVSDLSPGLSPGLARQSAKGRNREPIVFPVPIAPGFFDLKVTRDFVAGFLGKFFPVYDSDRSTLLPVYAPSCTFSFSTDTVPPSRSRAKRIGAKHDKSLPNQHKLDWKDYITATGSRNLTRVRRPEKRVATLHITPQDVIRSLNSLPKTQHPLDDPTKFVFDCFTLPAFLAPSTPGGEPETAIMACVHGEFTELPCNGVRSFDRTFILAPAPPGSPAHNAGWPCVIVSEQMTVRGYSSPIAWAPEGCKDVLSTASGPASTSTSTQERAPGIVSCFLTPRIDAFAKTDWKFLHASYPQTDEQQMIVTQLQSVTNLTYSFAYMCLEQNAWVPETALANFQQLHASGAIPAEAFVKR